LPQEDRRKSKESGIQYVKNITCLEHGKLKFLIDILIYIVLCDLIINLLEKGLAEKILILLRGLTGVIK
jgi:hypothetical protein